MLSLVGLTDSYTSDGRVLVEGLQSSAYPAGVSVNVTDFVALASVYKQLNAPVGNFGMNAIQADTTALASGSSSDDSKYNTITSSLTSYTSQRDALAATIKGILNAAEFAGTPVNHSQASSLMSQAQLLLWKMSVLAKTH